MIALAIDPSVQNLGGEGAGAASAPSIVGGLLTETVSVPNILETSAVVSTVDMITVRSTSDTIEDNSTNDAPGTVDIATSTSIC